MGWSATGIIVVLSGGVDFTNITWTPGKNDLTEREYAQAGILKQALKEAAQEGLIDGTYSCSILGNYSDNDRKSISLNLSPINGNPDNSK